MMAGSRTEKEEQPEMEYLVCLNTSTAFPFTWKIKQTEGCLRSADQIASPGGLRGLSGPGKKHHD